MISTKCALEVIKVWDRNWVFLATERCLNRLMGRRSRDAKYHELIRKRLVLVCKTLVEHDLLDTSKSYQEIIKELVCKTNLDQRRVERALTLLESTEDSVQVFYKLIGKG